MYKALFFDLDDTLWDFSKNAEESFMEVYQKFSFGRYFMSFDHFYSLYEEKNKELWYAFGKGLIDRETLNTDRFRYPLERVGVFNNALAADYATSFFDIISSKTQLKLGAKEVLEVLYKRYPLYIISNGFKELQYRKMESAQIHHYFKGIILSDHVGYNKPHPAIFKYALDLAQVRADEAVMVGDNWVADICGAKEVGMDQVFYSESCSEVNLFQPTYFITDLRKLLKLL